MYIGQSTQKHGFRSRYRFKGNGAERILGYYEHFRERNYYYNEHLYRAIKKYGCDAFEVDEVHDTAMSQQELNEKEIYYVNKYDSYNHGYNNTYGGDSFPKGTNHKNNKAVCQIGVDGKLIKVWESAIIASEALGIHNTDISQACSGKFNTSGGFVWVLAKDYDSSKDYRRRKNYRREGRGRRPVVLLDDNNNILQEFYSGEEASEILGVSKQTVCNICRGKYLTKLYNLKYKSEYLEEQRLNMEGSCEAS